jgi:hypothetical protein
LDRHGASRTACPHERTCSHVPTLALGLWIQFGLATVIFGFALVFFSARIARDKQHCVHRADPEGKDALSHLMELVVSGLLNKQVAAELGTVKLQLRFIEAGLCKKWRQTL